MRRIGNYPAVIRRPSVPTVISLIALFVALGGTSYAVVKLPPNSVGTRQLKPNAVTGSKIRSGSVARGDLAPSARTGARGPRGPAGPTGDRGAAGDAAAPEAWKALPFAGSWSNYGGPWAGGAYRKDQRGRVYLRGLATKISGVPAANDVIATLPAGYRPSARLLFAVGSGANTVGEAYGRVDVLANGDVAWIAGGAGDVDFTSLETVSFWAD